MFDEGSVLAWDHTGLAFDPLERTEEAQHAYTQTIELKPDYASK